MSKRILVLSKYPRMGASSRLRTLQYLPMLEQQGFNFAVHSLFDEAYLNNLYGTGGRSRLAVLGYYFKRLLTLSTVWRYDLVWIENELFPYFPAVFEKLLAVFGVKYIVDSLCVDSATVAEMKVFMEESSRKNSYDVWIEKKICLYKEMSNIL